MSFQHDSTGVNPDQEFELLPEGWFPFRIREASELTSKKGLPMILVQAEVINDERHNGSLVFHYVTFIPKGQKGDGISVHFRKCIGVPFGGNDTVDALDWEGKKFMGYVTHETYEGKTRNKLSKISPISSDKEKVTEVGLAKEEDIPF